MILQLPVLPDFQEVIPGVAEILPPLRSNKGILISASKSRTSRLTAGCVTPIKAPAAVMLPVWNTARNASTCR